MKETHFPAEVKFRIKIKKNLGITNEEISYWTLETDITLE